MQRNEAKPETDRGGGLTETITRLSRRLERERAARTEAEQTAEKGLRDLYFAKRDLDVLCAVAARANTSSRADQILRPAVDAILDATGWPLGAVYECYAPVANDAKACLTVARREDLATLAKLIEKSPLILEPGTEAATALKNGDAYFNADFRDGLMPFAQAIVAGRAGMQLSVLVPVQSRDRLVAVMQFMSPSSSCDKPRIVALLSQIADQVAHVYERQQMTEQLVHNALHDPMTGLANRQLFADRLNRVAHSKKMGGRDYSVLFLDLDRFKAVNDTLGHAAGDNLLIEVASRINQAVAQYRLIPEPTVARVGGDEFCILVENEAGPDCSIGQKLAHDLVSQIARPFILGTERAEIGVSIGVAPSVEAILGGEFVLKSADKAMYGAKSKGRGQVQLYDQRFREFDVRRERLVNSLRHAVNEDFRGFSVAFQPIVDLETSKLSGFEALLRFSDESGTAITPDEFIPLAEEHGLIQKLGRFVFENALEAQSRFNGSASSNPKFSISINVSPLQLSPSFPTIVREALDRHGADPSLVAIEITENVIIDRSRTTIDVLDALRDIGLNISIDDFGAGYANFGSLRQFSFKTLKIDRSFIDALMAEDGRQIVKAIIDMGRGLGVGMIAEGIETLEQAERLRELRCSKGQGYHFSRPLTYDEAVQSIVREVSINGSHAA